MPAASCTFGGADGRTEAGVQAYLHRRRLVLALDIMNDDGLIGPFLTRDDAEKDAREALGIREPRRHLVAIEPTPRPASARLTGRDMD